MFRPKRKAVLYIVLAGALLILSSSVFAQDIGTIADNATTSVNKVGKAIQVAARLAGLILCVLGVYTHYKAGKDAGQGRASHGIAVLSWVCGAVLFFVSSLVNTTGNTLWGTGGGDKTTIQINS